MSRLLAPLALFLILAILQTSFFASLPGVLSFTPLVLAAGVYLIQHAGQRFGALAVGCIGLWVSILGIALFPGEWAASAVAGVAAYASSRHLFSNRSWYGLIACGCLTVAAGALVQTAILAAAELRHPERVSWHLFGSTALTTAILNVILLTVFFALDVPIRTFLRTILVTAGRRELS